MGTIADKLTYLNATKTAIKSAIVNKGVSVADSDTFRSYADKIASIETGIEEISTADAMTALLVEANVGKVYRFTGTTDDTYTNGDLYEVMQEEIADGLAGTWVFNNQPHFSPFTDDPSLFNLNLTVGTLSAVNIYFESERVPMMSDAVAIVINYGLTGRKTLYSSGSWQDESYKTITITSKLSEVTNGDTLLAWLQSNATKQGASTPTLISFSIDGTSYQAEEGMTWEQWVASSYNTGGFYVTAGNTRVIFSNGADYVSSEGFAGDYANNTSQIVANGTYYKFSSGGGGN